MDNLLEMLKIKIDWCDDDIILLKKEQGEKLYDIIVSQKLELEKLKELLNNCQNKV